MTRYSDDSGSEPVDLGEGKVEKQTDKAILFKPTDEAAFWVPQSVVHDDSEVFKEEQEGTLLVKRWWAEKNGKV